MGIERSSVEEYGRVRATLIGARDDFGRAETALREAFIVALERWQVEGRQPKPVAGVGEGDEELVAWLKQAYQAA